MTLFTHPQKLCKFSAISFESGRLRAYAPMQLQTPALKELIERVKYSGL
jgi:hypothetical protein